VHVSLRPFLLTTESKFTTVLDKTLFFFFFFPDINFDWSRVQCLIHLPRDKNPIPGGEVLLRMPYSGRVRCKMQRQIANMSVRQGGAMDSLKFHLGAPCPTHLRLAGGPPLKRPYSHFRDGPSAGRAACGCLLPLRTPPAVRLYASLAMENLFTLWTRASV
jgi:hypothetical protein